MSQPAEPFDGDERFLGEMFDQVWPPPSLPRSWEGAPVMAARRRRWVPVALISRRGERRLRPLAAALILPVLIGSVAAAFGLHARLTGSALSDVVAGGPAARAGAAMAFDADRGVVVLFGGADGRNIDRDTWAWNGERWAQLSPPASPPARSDAAMAWDSDLHSLVLFGGRAGSAQLDDTWRWDGSTWHLLNSGTQRLPAVSPMSMASPRASMAYDPDRHELILVRMIDGPPMNVRPLPGGGTVSEIGQPVVSTWVLRGAAWIRQTTIADVVSGWDAANVGYDPIARRVVLLSPHREPSCNVTTVPGSRPVVSGTPTSHALSSAPSAAGTTLPVPQLSSSPVSARATPSAVQVVAGPPPNLAPTSNHPVTTSPVSSPCSMRPPQVSPPTPRPEPGSPAANCQGCLPIDAWWWDGSGWHAGSYGGLAGLVVKALMADPQRQQLLVARFSELWGWDGHGWVRRSTRSPLDARSDVAVTTDVAHGSVVLFGGSLSHGHVAGDTWTWDGHSWAYRAGPKVVAPTPMPSLPLISVSQNPIHGSNCFASGMAVAEPVSGGGVRISEIVDERPDGCAAPHLLTAQLIDRMTGKPLDVQGNSPALHLTGMSINLLWSNWCGSRSLIASLLLTSPGSTWYPPIDGPLPSCADHHAPSTLRVTS